MNSSNKIHGSRLIRHFKNKPEWYYSMSIAATWAGVGSLMMGIEMVQKNGLVPFLIWGAGNTLACIVFGLLAPNIPYLRTVFNTKLIKIAIGLMCPFQIWLTLNGIQSVFVNTVLPDTFGIVFPLILSVVFVVILWKYGMIRNVLTDYLGWVLVYGLVAFLTIASLVYTKGETLSVDMGLDNIPSAIEKFFLLIAGPFLYPYFFEILNYNDHNEDQTRSVNTTKVFVNGGLLFGFYLLFTLVLAITRFSPVLNVIKAFLIVMIGISTLSSFIYGIYISFGKKLGLAINGATIVLWQFLIPLGVMGVWTLMSTIRFIIVCLLIISAIIYGAFKKHKEHNP